MNIGAFEDVSVEFDHPMPKPVSLSCLQKCSDNEDGLMS